MTSKIIADRHSAEVENGLRFEFGKNWARFLEELTPEQVNRATDSLRDMLGIADLEGLRFVDVGCGSGLFSLAAFKLGATVHSIDYDPESVRCCLQLRAYHAGDEGRWIVEEGSVLDTPFLEGLGQFDIVYSWGVLHHTGEMWSALENATRLVAPGGKLFISIYNDQGGRSRRWLRIKMTYNRLPPLRPIILAGAFVRLWGPSFVRDLLAGRPGHSWRTYGDNNSGRGMSPWHDVVDWVGGYPFEVATPEQIVDFAAARDLRLKRIRTCGGGHGCNEYLLELITSERSS
jgi:2-polyprenyl-3-methyl-5-hydroxy-6-metoxy-1,4-benzoquinol methylase